ncbi:MAG: hypothetical protein HQL31_12880 [Planctomycetes bacterium]|nr:hypothetical protein [Planctomycetota bacterium]
MNGILLAGRTGADIKVVRLFACLHGSRGFMMDMILHGQRGADFASSLRNVVFTLDNDAFEKLCYPIFWHTNQDHTKDISIGTC